MKYYIVHIGYEDFIQIDETELSKALLAQMTGKVVMLKNGSVRGNSISMIEPDYRRAMGWNEGYKLTAEDFDIIGRECKEYIGSIESAKLKVGDLLKSGDEKLLLN